MGWRNKLCCGLTSAALLTALALPAAGAWYPDLPEEHWAYAAMDRAVELHIINGVGEGRMTPAQPLTWGQLLTMLARACDSENYERHMVLGESWDQAGLSAVQDLGWLPEWDFLEVGPGSLSRPITRSETVALLERALPLAITLPEGQSGPELPVQEGLADWAELEEDFQMPVSRLYQLQVVRGDQAGRFHGDQILRRADGAVLLMRTVELRRQLEVQQPVEPLAPVTPPELVLPPEAFVPSAPETTPEPTPEPPPGPTPEPTPEPTQPVEPPAPAVPEGPLRELWNNDDKRLLLFGTTDQKRFSQREEAEACQVDITVPVWQLVDGEKVPAEMTLTVHRGVAQGLKAAFEEIYNDPEQFPIHDLGGFRWGDGGEHGNGTAIDINANENYQIKRGQIIAGSYWKPGEDPLSIPEDSSVVRILASYGWSWGGTAWAHRDNHDYMHFSYLGE